jgi:hypothetical protein
MGRPRGPHGGWLAFGLLPILLLAPGHAFAARRSPAGVGGPKKLVVKDHGRPPFDVRANAPARRAPTVPQLELRASLGASGVLEIDRVTGTPRVVAKLDGFLTRVAGPGDNR